MDTMDTKENPNWRTLVSFVSVVVIQRRYGELKSDLAIKHNH